MQYVETIDMSCYSACRCLLSGSAWCWRPGRWPSRSPDYTTPTSTRIGEDRPTQSVPDNLDHDAPSVGTLAVSGKCKTGLLCVEGV